MSRPVVSKEMPVHDWLRDHYAEDKHLLHEMADPSSNQGSGVYGDYIAVVEQREAFFTQKPKRFPSLHYRDRLRPRSMHCRDHLCRRRQQLFSFCSYVDALAATVHNPPTL